MIREKATILRKNWQKFKKALLIFETIVPI